MDETQKTDVEASTEPLENDDVDAGDDEEIDDEMFKTEDYRGYFEEENYGEEYSIEADENKSEEDVDGGKMEGDSDVKEQEENNVNDEDGKRNTDVNDSQNVKKDTRLKEADVGIKMFVSDHEGFFGIIKQR